MFNSLKYSSIKQKYKDYYNSFYLLGKIPIKDTKLGMWGVSSIEDVYEIFKRLDLSNSTSKSTSKSASKSTSKSASKSFLDLGSGDGKVVLLASLFFENVFGIECDSELFNVSNDFSKKLKIKAEFKCSDYMNSSLSKYDWIFINPDHKLDELEEKLLVELNGKIIVYSNIYSFSKLKKIDEFLVNGIKVLVYEN